MTPGTLSWQAEGEILRFVGELDRQSLLCFWEQRHTLLQGKQILDLTAVTRIDSAGLAMLIHLQHEVNNLGQLQLIGGSERLATLVTLYNLHEVISIQQKSNM